MRFSSRAGDAAKFEKIASPARAKYQPCSRGLMDAILLEDEKNQFISSVKVRELT